MHRTFHQGYVAMEPEDVNPPLHDATIRHAYLGDEKPAVAVSEWPPSITLSQGSALGKALRMPRVPFDATR